MSTNLKLLPVAAVAVLATLLLAAGCGGSDLPAGAASAKAGAARPAQHVSVRARDNELVVKGSSSLQAGFVRFDVRNEGRGEHGIELVRLKRPLTTAQLLQAFAAESRAFLEALGGVQQVVRHRPWEMTVRLDAGSYALLDFAETGSKPNYARGLFKRFDVTPSQAAGVPPPTVGGIELRDYRFDLSLPNGFSGRGVVKITNLGQARHEISLVRIEPGHTQDEVLSLILSGAEEAREWASIIELLSVLDPGKTAYVKFDLRPGRYVALCLIDEHGPHKLHAELGMIATFDVT